MSSKQLKRSKFQGAKVRAASTAVPLARLLTTTLAENPDESPTSSSKRESRGSLVLFCGEPSGESSMRRSLRLTKSFRTSTEHDHAGPSKRPYCQKNNQSSRMQAMSQSLSYLACCSLDALKESHPSHAQRQTARFVGYDTGLFVCFPPSCRICTDSSFDTVHSDCNDRITSLQSLCLPICSDINLWILETWSPT